MKRNARFWSVYSVKVIAIVLWTLVVLEVLSCLFGYRFETFGSFLSELRAILLVSAAAILFCVSNGAQTLYIPLLLSHGETRKDVFIGYTATKLGICAVTVLISVVLALLSGEAGTLRGLPTEALVLLCVSAFGGIAGTLFVNLKWLGTLLFVLVCAGLGGVVGYLTNSSGGTAKLINAIREAMEVTPWWLCVVAAVLVCADLGYHWATLRHREVRL